MKACRLEKSTYTPVWLMRQAGRYMREYREIRQRLSFLDFCRDTDLVAEITVKAQEFLDADAAIIFSDILLLIEAFGMELEYTSEGGPIVRPSVGEGKKIEELRPVDIEESLGFVFKAIRKTRRSLKKNIPLLGFAGAPFTLASYMIEGRSSRDFSRTKTLMYREPQMWSVLMNRITESLLVFLRGQIEAGVQAVQLFDSWVGCLGPGDYREYVKPYTARLINGLESGAPLIHFGTGTSSLLEAMREAGGDVIGVDFRTPLGEAWKRIGYDKAIQGNLDPLVLCGERPFIRKRVQEILAQAEGRPGHIFNLGHGVLPTTPPDHVRYLVDVVHELSQV